MIVVATLPDGSKASSTPVPMSSISASGTQVIISPILLKTAGTGTINVQATSIYMTSSLSILNNVNVEKTNSLGIVYVPVTGLFGNINSDVGGTIQDHQKNSDEFIQGIFPLSENGVNSQIATTTVIASTASGNLNEIIDDVLQVLVEGTLTNPSARNAVGVIPATYFTAHGLSAAQGVTLGCPNHTCPSGVLPAPVSLVTDGWWTTTAHEIGLTFGLPDLAGGVSVDGYWVDQNLPRKDSYDFELSTLPGNVSQNIIFRNLYEEWISSSEYFTILKNLLTIPADPQVITISGTLSSTGQINLQPTFFLSNGVSTPFNSVEGVSVQAVSSDGSVLAQSSFQPFFNLHTNTGVDIATTLTPFLVQLPFTQGADTVQITHAGKSLAQFNPNSQLLTDAIKNIPSSSFIKNSKIEEQLLLLQAKAIEDLLAACQQIQVDKYHDNFSRVLCTDEAEELVLGLRREISAALNDSTQTSTPLQMTKSGVLSTVDFIALQLLGSPVIQAAGRSFDIKVLPNDSAGILSINSVTQGNAGSVYIGKYGTITYKPNPGNIESDSFTVAVQDTEGATVTKTISIILPYLDLGSINRWGNRFNKMENTYESNL